MHGATLLFWPMSLGWHDTWIPRCSILPRRRMCGRNAMMPPCLHGGWFMGTSCMACGVLTVWHNYVRPLVHT